LITSKNGKDDIWLGDGMYFWDNKGNVDWWNNKQRNRKTNETFSIVRVNVNADNIGYISDYRKADGVWVFASCLILARVLY